MAKRKTGKVAFVKARRPHVVLTTVFHEDVIRKHLAPHVKLTITDNPSRALIAGADALISMVNERVDHVLLAGAKNLRVVGNMAVGLDNIDLKACHELGVRVVHTPKAVTRATAEMALALLLSAARHVAEADRTCRKPGPWRWTPSMLTGLELKGRNAVLVGQGRIGRETARLFRGVGMKTEFIRRTDSASTVRHKLARAQVLSLHMPLTPGTRHWLDAKKIAHLPSDAIVVNTARGPVIDERALISALRKKRIFAAALDVHENEPHIASAMKRLTNVTLMPHIGTATRETRRAMAELVISGVLGILAGQDPWNEVDLTRYVKGRK